MFLKPQNKMAANKEVLGYKNLIQIGLAFELKNCKKKKRKLVEVKHIYLALNMLLAEKQDQTFLIL